MAGEDANIVLNLLEEDDYFKDPFNVNSLKQALTDACERYSCDGTVAGVGPTLVFGIGALVFVLSEFLGAHRPADVLPPERRQRDWIEHVVRQAMACSVFGLLLHLWLLIVFFLKYFIYQQAPWINETHLQFLGLSKYLEISSVVTLINERPDLVHLSVCWAASCLALDYVRRRCCRNFQMPRMEEWVPLITAMDYSPISAVSVGIASLQLLDNSIRYTAERVTPVLQEVMSNIADADITEIIDNTVNVVTNFCLNIINTGSRISNGSFG